MKGYASGRTCSSCPSPIRDKNKGGRCKPCHLRSLNADADMVKRRGEAIRQHCRRDPLFKAALVARCKRNRRNAMKNPTARENIISAAMRNLPLAFTPEAIAKQRKGLIRGGKKYSDRMLAWCPPEKRDRYRRLRRNGHRTAAVAKQMILDEIKAELEALSPFERQMRALQNGGRIVANDRRPGQLEPTFSDPTLRRVG